VRCDVAIALVETLHGILRIRFLNRPLGARRASQVGVLTGSLLILAIGWLTVPWIGVRTMQECLVAGTLWLSLMLGFELVLGHWIFRLPWRRLAAEYDLRKGGFLGLGMLVLFFTPLIMATVHGVR
jgi:hypothetical protein